MQQTQNHPYWWEDENYKAVQRAQPARDLPAKVGTLVVGAGYSGLSAALTLARAGREVVVIDADAVGFGCSARNGGLIGPSFHKLGIAGLTRAFGQAKAHAMLHESMDTLRYLKNLIKTEKIDCGLHPTGRFGGAPNIKAYDATAREAEHLNKAVGLEFEMVAQTEQHREIGTDRYYGGIVYPNDGHLHPGQYLSGLAERVFAEGVRIFAPARMTGVRQDGDKFEVNVNGQSVKADQVLIATNGYSGPELPFFQRRIIPIRSAMIATEPLPAGTMDALSPKGRSFIELSRLVLYFRPSPDRTRMVFGGRAFDLADRPDHYIPDLKRLMIRIFPQLDDVAISHAWSGTIAYTFDYTPHLGTHNGLYYVMGYCGSGVGRSTYFGHKAALKMLGSNQGETELDGITFPTRPLYTGKPWFLPAVLRWHSLLDRFGA
jgi:glycine/D-amino acid oxidase-like deaminating enzyme